MVRSKKLLCLALILLTPAVVYGFRGHHGWWWWRPPADPVVVGTSFGDVVAQRISCVNYVFNGSRRRPDRTRIRLPDTVVDDIGPVVVGDGVLNIPELVVLNDAGDTAFTVAPISAPLYQNIFGSSFHADGSASIDSATGPLHVHGKIVLRDGMYRLSAEAFAWIDISTDSTREYKVIRFRLRGTAPLDSDGDGTPDVNDGCPDDPAKIDPGICGCGVDDAADSDGDGTPDCIDNCPSDPDKTDPGICGCGVVETDTDGDGTPDCIDNCPSDPDETDPGICGCGVVETDTDGDGTPDCVDLCPLDPDPNCTTP